MCGVVGIHAPGQEAAIQLLSQLYFSNLLQYDTAADAAQLFERYKKRRQREIGSRFLNIMFMRFPLLDPDRFLVRIDDLWWLTRAPLEFAVPSALMTAADEMVSAVWSRDWKVVSLRASLLRERMCEQPWAAWEVTPPGD